jgi:nitroreductase
MPTYEQVREMIVTRRSVRNFQDRRVEREVLEKVIDGACYAPSAKNSRSTEYIVVTDKALLAEIAAITAQWLGDVSRKLRNPLWRRLYMLYGEKDVEEIKRWVNQFDLIAERARNHWDVILFKAPAVLFFHARRSIRFGETNAALAVQNAVYTASSLGLGSFFTGYVVAACSREKRLPLLLGLPKGHILYGGLALGYPELGFPTWIERTAQHITWRDGT